jgi:hypothetical protein
VLLIKSSPHGAHAALQCFKLASAPWLTRVRITSSAASFLEGVYSTYAICLAKIASYLCATSRWLRHSAAMHSRRLTAVASECWVHCNVVVGTDAELSAELRVEVFLLV